MMCFASDMNGEKLAPPYAEDYRRPDRLAVAQGEVDKTDAGDLDKDGFNELEGCYVLKSGPTGTGFTLHGSELPRMQPVFKIKGWVVKAPSKIVVGGKELEGERDSCLHSQGAPAAADSRTRPGGRGSDDSKGVRCRTRRFVLQP